METNEQKKATGVRILRSYYDAIKKLDDASIALMFKSIMEFGLDDVEPNFDSPMLEMAWTLIKPNLESGKNYDKSKVENGSKGGKAKAIKAQLEAPQVKKIANDTKVPETISEAIEELESTENPTYDVIELFCTDNMNDEDFNSAVYIREHLQRQTNRSLHSKEEIKYGIRHIQDNSFINDIFLKKITETINSL
jgi:hypothetical protein